MQARTRALGACCLLAVSLFAASPGPSSAAPVQQDPASAGTTIHLTPQGKITQITVDSSNTQTIYVGTDAAGVYRSDNGGATWVLASKGLPSGVAINRLTVDLLDKHAVVYAATEKGVFRSDDKGATWASQGPPTSSGSTSLAIDPITPATLYAGTGGDGIYRSTDGGATWAAIGPRLSTVTVVATDPISGTTIYAGTDDGLLYFKSTGAWQRAGLGHVAVQALAISASDPNVLYVGTSQGVLVSRDGGVNWARAGLVNPDISVTALYVDRQDPQTVFAASADGGGFFSTTNGGHTWHALVAGLSSHNVLSLAFDPGDPRTVYAGLDQGVFKSLQDGASWASSSIYDRSVHALLQPPSLTGTFYAGTNGGVYASRDGGSIWTSAGLGNHTIESLLTVQDALLAANEAGVYRSTDGGVTWQATLRFPALILLPDPAAPGAVLAGTTQGLFRSADAGRRWGRLPAGTVPLGALLAQDGAIFAAGEPGLLVSTDDGATFKRHDVNGETVAQLLAQPGTGGAQLMLYARAASGALARSADAGLHWTDCSVGQEKVTSLTLGTDGNLYAATAAGIYRSSSRGFSWILTNQRDQSLHPLVLQPALGGSSNTLLAGLDGQGVIQFSLHTTPASPFAPLVNANVGRYFPDTGHFVRAPFLDWYTAHNGPAIFGPPLTEALHENGQLVQYFQNALLVYHRELDSTPQAIQLAPLGQQTLGTPVTRLAAFENTTQRRYFPQSGHSLSGEFLSFWRTYGGIDVFGYPLSEPVMSKNRLVQYFQNARFEASSGAGAQYFDTQLSPLGANLVKQKGWLP